MPMFISPKLSLDKNENYALMLENLSGYLDRRLPPVSNLANMSAIIACFFADINWAGFYLHKGRKLILGPFQGLPACTEIRLGKGVCGTAALRRETVVVDDVGSFPGHIACDGNSRSEIVVPIMKDGALYGVLDVDSPLLSRFGTAEKTAFEKAVALLVDIL
jgi:L-methionine (R)-S-oxide reductase